LPCFECKTAPMLSSKLVQKIEVFSPMSQHLCYGSHFLYWVIGHFHLRHTYSSL
jgi:hypothetical protein